MAILKKGSKGDQVKEVQAALKQSGYNISVDGIFGPGMEAVVKEYQKKHGLVVDGIIGQNTIAQIMSAPKNESAKVVAKKEPAKLLVTDRFLEDRQYGKEVTAKNTIYIHHTAGNSRADLVIDGWASNDVRVGTAYVIGGKDSRVADMDGKIYRAFDDKHWCHHLGTKLRNNLALNQQSVGIEVCAWGPLTMKNGKFYNYVNREVHIDEVCVLDKPFRGFKFYHAYTPKQIEALRDLILNISLRHNIPLKKVWTADSFEMSDAACEGKAGIYTHTNVRSDKSDMFPMPELINMLNSL
jgi:N-acetyl-anhydromuramyl-L-alanine amidase AmpD